MHMMIKPGTYDQRFKKWVNQGITASCTIVENGEIISSGSKGNIQFGITGFFRYLQLKDYYIKGVKQPNSPMD